MDFLNLLLEALYFIAPAYVANMMPVLSKGVPFLGKPISTKYLGKNKTYRGFLFGVVGGILTVWLQRYLYSYSGFEAISLIDYHSVSVLFFGFLFGFGAIFGDAIESFFKRRIGIESGGAWFPFDQLDFVVFGVIFVLPVVWIGWGHLIVLLLLTPLLHFLTNVVAYKLGLKDVPW